MYEYLAEVVDVHDGDTITVDIDLGFGVWARKQKIRLMGLNAPELATPDGALSRDFLNELVMGRTVIVQTKKDRKEKYGRWLGTIWAGKVNVNELLLAKNLAVEMN